jgi:hypothetical protein
MEPTTTGVAGAPTHQYTRLERYGLVGVRQKKRAPPEGDPVGERPKLDQADAAVVAVPSVSASQPRRANVKWSIAELGAAVKGFVAFSVGRLQRPELRYRT